MDVKMIVQYRIDLRILSKALRGTLADFELADALALQEKIMLERTKQARNFVQSLRRRRPT